MSFKYTNLPPPLKLRKLWALTAVAAITIHPCIANELNDLYFDGITNGDGNPVYDKKYLNSDGSLKSEYDNIHIHLNDVSPTTTHQSNGGYIKAPQNALSSKNNLLSKAKVKP